MTSTTPARILLAEDNPSDALLVREALREQADRDIRPPELAAQALDRVDDDAWMVEAERR